MCNPSNIAYFTLDIKGNLKSFIHSFRDVFFDRYRYIEYYALRGTVNARGTRDQFTERSKGTYTQKDSTMTVLVEQEVATIYRDVADAVEAALRNPQAKHLALNLITRKKEALIKAQLSQRPDMSESDAHAFLYDKPGFQELNGYIDKMRHIS